MKRWIVLFGATGLVLAQTEGVEVEKLRKKLELTKATVSYVSGMVHGPTVTGAPYSAQAVTESTQILYDGNRIVNRSTTALFRDSQGRERREESAPMEAVFITDPVAKISYTLHPENRTAEKQAFFAGEKLVFSEGVKITTAVAGRGAGKQGTIRLAGPAGDTLVHDFVIATPPVASAGGRGAGPKVFFFDAGAGEAEIKSESLGMRMIEGVQAEGSRTVHTIPAGQIGNDRPIEVVDERWYSPDLQMTVMTRHSDPRTGETVYKLTNIQRIEQPPTLFEVPTSYSIEDRAGRK